MGWIRLSTTADFKDLQRNEPVSQIEWNGHRGPLVESRNGFDIIECEVCGFKHATPIPTEEELESVYSHEYYTQEKPLYIERYQQDLDWWNTVYTQRYEIFEKFLPVSARRILDIGSGPGYFLLNGRGRGWQAKGIEPSERAAIHTRDVLGLDVDNCFFNEDTANNYGSFDVINMGEVLEHVPDPTGLLRLAHSKLAEGGIICLIVPNDFNPFQIALQKKLGFDPWWVAPPHHLNYFTHVSLKGLVERVGYEVLHMESTFPIDMFLLMGKNYVGNDTLGREVHGMRKTFDLNLVGAGDLHSKLYTSFASLGLGREIVLYVRKR